jgi:hypothetical protein
MCGRHMHPDSAGRREADFAIRVAARLFDIDLSVIQVQLELGTIWYAVPGPFGPIPKNYLPQMSQAQHARLQENAAAAGYARYLKENQSK